MQFYGKYHLSDHSKNSFEFSSDAALYNKKELMNMLQLRVGTDLKEILLRSYDRWKETCPEYFVGDFSFALYDKENQQLFCARDHLGIRPFYYCIHEDSLTFSSELDILFSLTDIDKKPDIASMESLAENRSVPHEKTMYKDIKRLPPGHTLTVKKDGTVHICRYWKPEMIQPDTTITFNEAVRKFNLLFTQAVRSRLPDDGTVGCELSGGLDSSSVCSVVHKLTDGRVSAFSMRFGEYRCDEGIFIETAAENLHLKPIEIQIDAMDFIYEYNMDMKYWIDPHWPVFLTYLQIFPLAKAVQKSKVKIVLTGQGGDHVMSGNLHALTDYLRKYQWKKLFYELSALGFSKKYIKNYLLIPLLGKRPKKIIQWIQRKLHPRSPVKTKQVKKSTFFDEGVAFHSKAFKHDVDILLDEGFSTVFDSSAYHGAKKLYGIEYRHPFFDIRLVEFMLSLPAEFKYSKKSIKVLLRAAMKGMLPEKIRQRKDKAEFSETIMDQLKAIDIEMLFKNASIVDLGIVSEEKLDMYIRQYRENRLAHLLQFWTLVNLEMWVRKIE